MTLDTARMIIRCVSTVITLGNLFVVFATPINDFRTLISDQEYPLVVYLLALAISFPLVTMNYNAWAEWFEQRRYDRARTKLDAFAATSAAYEATASDREH